MFLLLLVFQETAEGDASANDNIAQLNILITVIGEFFDLIDPDDLAYMDIAPPDDDDDDDDDDREEKQDATKAEDHHDAAQNIDIDDGEDVIVGRR